MTCESKFRVEGGTPLRGNVRISGSKNAALPIIVATVLSDEVIELNEIPRLTDTENLSKILREMGAIVSWRENQLMVCNKNIKSETHKELSGKLRASVLFLGPLLAKYREVKVYMPGGCSIGSRPIDIHLKGLEKMGAKIQVENGYIHAKTKNKKRLVGDEIYLDFPSVGATENLMMAATLAEGKTTLINAAQEPEIVDLGNFLNSMGAKIEGLGSSTIVIHGVQNLTRKTCYTIIPDRIEAGTFLIAGAMNRKNRITIENIRVEHLHDVIGKLKDVGATFKYKSNGLEVIPPKKIKPIDIHTRPYPGFSTDLQPQMMTLLTGSDGVSLITETIFENRFHHVGELTKVGADIKVDKNTAIVTGVRHTFKGSSLKCYDLRAGISMVLAGINSKGESTISDIYHIKRGYENIIQKLRQMGAKIEEINY